MFGKHVNWPAFYTRQIATFEPPVKIPTALIRKGAENAVIHISFDPLRCDTEIIREIETFGCAEMHLAGSVTQNLCTEVHKSWIIDVNSFAGD